MISSTLYILGLLCRFGALFIAARVLKVRFSWRFVAIALAVVWISLQPIIQYFFSDSVNFISTVQTPEVFFITSVIALFAMYQLHEILVDNEHYAQKVSEVSDRFGRRQSILLDLSKQRSTDLTVTLAAIVKADSAELDVGRVGVWMFNEDRTAINSLVLLDKGVVTDDTAELTAKIFPAYFAALEVDGVIVADDARTHPATYEFEPEYLKPNNIFAMMDAPIRIDGEILGIICHEYQFAQRQWSQEDQDFAHSIADLCALAIAADKQRETEAQLGSTRGHLVDAQNTGQFGSFRWDMSEDDLLWSGDVMEKLGFTREGPQYEKFAARLVESDLERYDQAVRLASKEGKPVRVRIKTKPEFGSDNFEVRISFVKNEQYKLGCYDGTVHKINEQVLAEEENQRLESQLIQSQKMESIGTLAGGIAHDFNNILTPILGYTDVALAGLEPDSPIRAPLEEVLQGSLRAKDLVEQILIFSRQWDEKTEPVDLNESIRSALKLLRPTLPSTINIEVFVTPSCKLVEADSTQMVQVLLNLCTNAWHAMEAKGGTLTIRLYPTEHGEKEVTALSVSDTGSGIDQASLSRIFDPFFTTKEVGRGTGLGLSVVHGIITKHQGEITVESEPGATTFKIYLPITNESITIKDLEDEPASQQTGSILLVDDDEAVAGILEAMLSEMGYNIDVHLNSGSALDCFLRGEQHYDLLLTDLTMPNMSGIELIRKIRERSPTLPVIIVSGYGESQVSPQLIGLDRCQIVSKPITKAELATALKKELH